jgi:single-strand DNA-binding protein
MPNYNKVILIGHLTRDPELGQTQGGTTYCKGGIAVSEKWKSKDGTERKDTCFVDFVIWGARGEAFMRFHGKGDAAMIEGKLKLEQWTAEDGTKRSKHSVNVEAFSFVKAQRQDAPPPAEPGPAPPSDKDVPF